MPQSKVLKKQYKSPYPWANVKCHNEDLATDTIFSSEQARETCAQLFTGLTSLVTDMKEMKSKKQFLNTLEDIIIDRGAHNRLISDSTRVETSKQVSTILCVLFIGKWKSALKEQHQDPT